MHVRLPAAVLVLCLCASTALAADTLEISKTGTTSKTGNSVASFEVKGGKKLDPANWFVEITVGGTKYDATKCLPAAQGGTKGTVTIPGANAVGKTKVKLKVKLNDGTFLEAEVEVDFQQILEDPCPPPPPPPHRRQRCRRPNNSLSEPLENTTA